MYDIDGARYDYAHVPGSLTWTPPAGQHATLTYDGSCGLLWTKKSGTIYYFYRPDPTKTCPSLGVVGAYAGRLYQIIGRNTNIAITLTYTWDNPTAAAGSNVTRITATTESGMAATLNFTLVAGHNLLQSLVWPGGTTVSYGYDTAGDLTSVTLPPNNGTPPSFSDGVAPVQTYGYEFSGTQPYLAWAASPRWATAPGGCSGDLKTGCGAYLLFRYAYGASAPTTSLTELDHYGFMDPTPLDGTNTPIQPMPPGGSAVATAPALSEYYALGQLGSTSTPTLRDSDGHATNWVVDAAARPLQTQECAATQNQQCTVAPLVTGEQWDANNNLVAEVEPRGFAPGANASSYETDYAYDAAGNTVAVAQPAVVAQTRNGQQQIRPTQLYSYDQFNNVTAYCDQTWSQIHGKDWDVTGNPGSSDTLCPTTVGSATDPGATVMGYTAPINSDSSSYEPFGELTTITTPMGYQRTIRYDPGPQQGIDCGLPTSVVGTAIVEADGKTVLQLNQSYAYDASGNLVTYGTGNGTWNLSYDALNRAIVASDPDGHASYTSYFPDGTIRKTETPAQHATNVAGSSFDAGVLHTYDLDGDELTQVHHHGNVVGTTQNWYDGVDRLVEVALPGDSSSTAVHTRYLYDLSAGGSVSVGGLPVRAYGNLFDTQEYTTTTGSTTAGYVDARGQAFDALDRLVDRITFPPNADTAPVQAMSSYDASPATLGLLASTTDAVGEQARMSYDALGRQATVAFSGDNGTTPSRSFVYDPNGRAATITSSLFGAQSWVYDSDGRLTAVAEPSGSGFSSPAVIGYDYYLDGHRKDLTVQSSALAAPAASPLMTYLYRADGARTGLTFTYGGVVYPFSWTYSNGGRRTTQTDPFTGTAVPHAASVTPPSAAYAAKQWTYDANGELQALALPIVGKYTGMTHDLEGTLSAYAVQPSTPSAGNPPNTVYTFGIGNNVVGETVSETITNPGQAGASLERFTYSNGHAIPYVANLTGYPHSGHASYELINGVRTALQTWTTNSSNLQCPMPNVVSETYDNAGRHTATTADTYDNACTESTGTDPTTYDAENHPVQVVHNGMLPDYPGVETDALQWGPNGHPLALQSSVNSTTLSSPTSIYLHYDGDTLLFTTYANGALRDVRPELLGTLVPGASPQFGVTDRDFTELAVTGHSAVGYGSLNYGSGPFRNGKVALTKYVYESSSDGAQPDFTDDGEGLLQYAHPDGFYTPLGRIQGVRAMDPALGTWKSPDAYAGDVRDPMSQKPYMWNGNNPYQYSDPSGYCPICLVLIGIGAWLTMNGPAITAEVAAPGGGAALGIAGRGVWALGPGPRGLALEAELGGNLPRSFPVVDKVAPGAGGMASSVTSIKSMDMAAPSYSSGSAIASRVSGYVDKLSAFQTKTFDDVTVGVNATTRKILQLAIPADVKLTASQQAGLDSATAYAASRGVTLQVIRK